MKKKSLIMPALSGLLLSTALLATANVSAEELSSNVSDDTNLTTQPLAVSDNETEVADDSVTILHTNDIHGRIEEGRGVIGMAKLATVVDETRQEGTTLLLDAGDAFQGLPISNSTKGEDMADLMNAIGYDAMAVGNHEFDFSLEQAQKYKEKLTFPLLSVNTYVNDARLFDASAIIDKTPNIAGDEFVVIGVTTPETSTKTHPNNVNGVVFKDPVTEVNNVIAEIEARAKAEGKSYNRYIILAHLGIDATTPVEWQGSTLAKALADNPLLAGKLVIVLDGHSHTVHSAVYEGKTKVTYNQTGSYLNNIGKIKLNGKEILSTGVISFDETKPIVAKEDIAKKVADIKAKYDLENAKVVLENNPVELNGDRSNVRVRETNLGNIIADAVWSYGQDGFSNPTNLAVTNGGGIRATLTKDKPITKGDIISVLPFGNIISQITVTGQQIKEMFDKALSASLQKNSDGSLKLDETTERPLLEANGGFLHISGATVLYDVTKEPAERVLAIKIYDPETEEFLPLDLEKTYYLATNDFLAAGGDGYTMLGGAREEGPSMDAVFADYLASNDLELSDYSEVNPRERLIDVDAEQDTDQDGFTDVDEWLVDTKWDDADDFPIYEKVPGNAPTVDLPVYVVTDKDKTELVKVPDNAPTVNLPVYVVTDKDKTELVKVPDNAPTVNLPVYDLSVNSAEEADRPLLDARMTTEEGQTLKSEEVPVTESNTLHSGLSRVAKHHGKEGLLPKTNDVSGLLSLLTGFVSLSLGLSISKSKKD